MKDLSGWLTIIQVCRTERIEPENEMTWSVGAQVRDEWEAEMGYPPEKDLRVKTCGTGSHMFAVYPPSWYGRIAKLLRAYGAQSAKQLAMEF